MESASTAPLVSIIIPVYKVEEYLPRCLDSILAQTYPHWEALCIDDGSPDRCGEILDAYAARDSRFRVLHQENGGVSAARNAGLDMMRGEYLTMVDPDDSIDSTLLEKMVSGMQQHGSSIVSCGYREYEESGTYWDSPPLWCKAPEGLQATPLTSSVLYSIPSNNWAMLFLTSIWREAGLRYTPDCAYGEDHAILLRYLMHSKQVTTINEPLYHYYRRETSASRAFEHHTHSASYYKNSLIPLAHTVDSLPEETSSDFRGMWHYVVLRRFERTVNALNIKTHPEHDAIYRAVRECARHLKRGMTLKYRWAWSKHRMTEFKSNIKRRAKHLLKKILCRY